MRANELIKTIMKQKGVTYALLADKLGYRTASAISEKVRREKGMRTDTLVQILDAMDCEIIIRDKVGSHQKWNLSNEE